MDAKRGSSWRRAVLGAAALIAVGCLMAWIGLGRHYLIGPASSKCQAAMGVLTEDAARGVLIGFAVALAHGDRECSGELSSTDLRATSTSLDALAARADQLDGASFRYSAVPMIQDATEASAGITIDCLSGASIFRADLVIENGRLVVASLDGDSGALQPDYHTENSP